MVKELDEGMEDEESDDLERVERLLSVYHACVEAKKEIAETIRRGDGDLQEWLALSETYESLTERLGAIKVKVQGEMGQG